MALNEGRRLIHEYEPAATAYAHHELTVIGGVDEVKIACEDRLVATHPRIWQMQRSSLDPVHYLLSDDTSSAYNRQLRTGLWPH